jgi:hypothetical protein
VGHKLKSLAHFDDEAVDDAAAAAAPNAPTPLPSPLQQKRSVAAVDAHASALHGGHVERLRISKRGSIDIQFPLTPTAALLGAGSSTDSSSSVSPAQRSELVTQWEQRLKRSVVDFAQKEQHSGASDGERVAAARATAASSASAAVAASPIMVEMARVAAHMQAALGDRLTAAAGGSSAHRRGGGLTAKLLAAKKRFDVGDINARQLAEQKSEIMRAALMGM